MPPTSTETVWFRLPVPLAGHDEPDDATHVHVGPTRSAGSVSVTVAPVTLDGPLFETIIVYVIGDPGTTVVAPSVFVTPRSADRFSGSLSVAVLFEGVPSVVPLGTSIVAVLLKVPDEPALTVAFTVKVTVEPGARFTGWLIEPLPDAAQLAPALAEQVQVAASNPAGKVSATVAPVTADGPALDATIV